MTADLSAAIAALTAELDDRPGVHSNAGVIPILSHLTIGHLRAIRDALSGGYCDHLPTGAVEVTEEQYCQELRHDRPRALVTVYAASRKYVSERYYTVPAVRS